MNCRSMLQTAGALAFGLSVATASATDYVNEDFENIPADTLIKTTGVYSGGELTSGWGAGEDDTSKVVAGADVKDVTGYPGQALQVNTGRSSLTNKFASVAVGDEAPELFLDQKVKFTPSASVLSMSGDTETKLGFFAVKKANEEKAHLAVYSSIQNSDGSYSKVVTPTDVEVATDRFVAVKIVSKKYPGSGNGDAAIAFQIKIDDTLVTSTNAYQAADLSSAYNNKVDGENYIGDWFLSATTANQHFTIRYVTFNGTGYIDDINYGFRTLKPLWPSTWPDYSDIYQDKFGTWMDRVAGKSDVGAADVPAFLMNVPADTAITLAIDSIAVNGNKATVAVKAGDIDLSAINGVLFIDGSENIADWETTKIVVEAESVSKSDGAVFEVEGAKFLKAKVDFVAPTLK